MLLGQGGMYYRGKQAGGRNYLSKEEGGAGVTKALGRTKEAVSMSYLGQEAEVSISRRQCGVCSVQ